MQLETKTFCFVRRTRLGYLIYTHVPILEHASSPTSTCGGDSVTGEVRRTLPCSWLFIFCTQILKTMTATGYQSQILGKVISQGKVIADTCGRINYTNLQSTTHSSAHKTKQKLILPGVTTSGWKLSLNKKKVMRKVREDKRNKYVWCDIMSHNNYLRTFWHFLIFFFCIYEIPCIFKFANPCGRILKPSHNIVHSPSNMVSCVSQVNGEI